MLPRRGYPPLAGEPPVPRPCAEPAGTAGHPRRVTAEGRLVATQVRPVSHSNVLTCRVADSTGEITAVFYGRTHIPGLEPGSRIRLHGVAAPGADGHPVIINPGL